MKKMLSLLVCLFCLVSANAQTPKLKYISLGIQVPSNLETKNSLYGVWTSNEFNICLLTVNKPDLCGSVVLSDKQAEQMVAYLKQLNDLKKGMQKDDKKNHVRTIIKLYGSFMNQENEETEKSLSVRTSWSTKFQDDQMENGNDTTKLFINTLGKLTDFFDRQVIEYQVAHPDPTLIFFYETTSPSGLEGMLVVNDKPVRKNYSLAYSDCIDGAKVDYMMFEKNYVQNIDNAEELQKELTLPLKFKEYVKPTEEYMVFDAPSYDFELLMSDGTRLTSNDERECANYPERMPKGRLDVDNMYQTSRKLEEVIDFRNKRDQMMKELMSQDSFIVR